MNYFWFELNFIAPWFRAIEKDIMVKSQVYYGTRTYLFHLINVFIYYFITYKLS